MGTGSRQKQQPPFSCSISGDTISSLALNQLKAEMVGSSLSQSLSWLNGNPQGRYPLAG